MTTAIHDHTVVSTTAPSTPGPLGANPSVPTFVLALIRPEFTAWDQVGCRVGDRVEVSTFTLEQLEAGLGLEAARYWDRCRVFWDRFAAGESGLVGLTVERELARDRQSTSHADRRDLVEAVEALEAQPSLASVVATALGNEPDWDALRSLGAVVEAGAKDTTVVTYTYRGRQDWPVLLGGLPSRGELARTFTFVVSHAKWRDRRNRRLVEFAVAAAEIWPDPQTTR